MKSGEALLRVEGGNPDAVELAALAAVLLLLRTAAREPGGRPAAPGPRRRHRSDAYLAPGSWRRGVDP